jgi:hypothetical protein
MKPDQNIFILDLLKLIELKKITLNDEVYIHESSVIKLMERCIKYDESKIVPQPIKRKEIVFDFVVRHKTSCYNAFKLCSDHKGFNTEQGSVLIEMARKEIGYSRKTWDGDIYNVLYRVYRGIVFEGANYPSEIR